MLKRFAAPTISCLALVLSIALPAIAVGGEGGTDRPFKGWAEGQLVAFTPGQPGSDVFGSFEIAYVGQATHMGAITRYEYATLYNDGSFEGLMIFTASNGDEITASFEGSFPFIGAPATGTGSYTFIDGTGRFADVSGTTPFEVYTPDFVNVSVSFDGTISY